MRHIPTSIYTPFSSVADHSRLVLFVQHNTIVTVLADCLMFLILVYLHRVKLYFVLNLILHVAEIVLTQKREQGIVIANFALAFHFSGFHQ